MHISMKSGNYLFIFRVWAGTILWHFNSPSAVRCGGWNISLGCIAITGFWHFIIQVASWTLMSHICLKYFHIQYIKCLRSVELGGRLRSATKQINSEPWETAEVTQHNEPKTSSGIAVRRR